MKTFNEIIQAYRMGDECDWFMRKNPSNNLPYHNKFHAECMVQNCHDGAQYHNLCWTATRSLLIAALFHDFDHTGGRATDTENIAQAIAGYSMFVGTVYNSPSRDPVVFDCICCTEYPFRADREPYTIEQRIIRDADLMQYKFPNWDEMYFVNLKAEVEVRENREVTAWEMVEGNRKFWQSVKIFTKWGKESLNHAPGPFREKMGIMGNWYHT